MAVSPSLLPECLKSLSEGKGCLQKPNVEESAKVGVRLEDEL